RGGRGAGVKVWDAGGGVLCVRERDGDGDRESGAGDEVIVRGGGVVFVGGELWRARRWVLALQLCEQRGEHQGRDEESARVLGGGEGRAVNAQARIGQRAVAEQLGNRR